MRKAPPESPAARWLAWQSGDDQPTPGRGEDTTVSGADRLEQGDSAPDFTLPDEHGTPVSLASLQGSKVVLYFYPAAMTPGCTTEACDFRDNLNSLKSAGYQAVAISKDDPAKKHQVKQ